MYAIKRFTRKRRETLTNWYKTHGARYILVGVGIGGEYAVSVVGRHQKRRYVKICKRLNAQ